MTSRAAEISALAAHSPVSDTLRAKLETFTELALDHYLEYASRCPVEALQAGILEFRLRDLPSSASAANMPSTGTSADAVSDGVPDASYFNTPPSSTSSDAVSDVSEDMSVDEFWDSRSSLHSSLYAEPSSDTSVSPHDYPSSDTSSSMQEHPSSPSQVSVESSDSSASSTTDMASNYMAPSRPVLSWWLLGLLGIVILLVLSDVLAVLARPGSQHAFELRMNASTDASYMDEICDIIYGDLSYNALVMSHTEDKLYLAIARAYKSSNLLDKTLNNLWPIEIRNGSIYKTLGSSRELRSATWDAIEPVRLFEISILPTLVKGRRAVKDSQAHEKKYNESGPQWFEQEAADLNDRESELSPSSGRRPWTGRELASKMHWESVCHAHDALREQLWDLTMNAEKVFVRIKHCRALWDEVEAFASTDILYRRRKMIEDAKRAKDDNEEWNARWSTKLYKSNKPILTTIMSWIIDPEPQEYRPPLRDYAVFGEVHLRLSVLENDLEILFKGLQYTWNRTLSGPEVDDVVSICSSRDDRGVSTAEEWHQARILLDGVWPRFKRRIDE